MRRKFYSKNTYVKKLFLFTKGIEHVFSLQVIHCSGYLRCVVEGPVGSEYEDGAGRHCIRKVGLLAVGHSLPGRCLTEVKLYQNMFMFRASLDLKLIFVDAK